MPLVSIVVPVYNVEKYLERCIISLVNQTLRDIEIILVDDESPDSSPSLCDKWRLRDERIKVIHKKNEGLGLTRNAGLKEAIGEYVAFVDSDDYVEPDMYERLYNECKQDSLDCIYSEFNVDDYPGFRVVLRPEKIYVGRIEIEQLRLDIVGAEPSYISGVKYHCSSCKGLYSLDTIRRNNCQFKSEREYIAEDMLFNLEFLSISERVKIVPWQFYHYCLNGASLTHTYRPDRWEKNIVMIKVLSADDSFANKSEFRLRLKRTIIFYTMTAIQQEKKRKDISKLKRRRLISAIEHTDVVEEAIKCYPIRELPIKWKIYSILLKYKMLEYVYMF